jgi:citrate lyase beta subunit
MSAGRARRALLFVPGDSARKIAKAAGSGADSVILDMEDGVALNAKAQARAVIAEGMRTHDFGRSERLIRVNPFGTAFHADDLAAAIAAHPDGIVLPKVESVEALQAVDTAIGAGERAHGLASGAIALLFMIETARAVADVRALCQAAGAIARAQAVIFGAEDLAGDMGAVRTAGGLEVAYARGAVVLHAKAFGLDAIDMVYTAYTDQLGLAAEAYTAMTMGYAGKQAIHPDQIAPIQNAFTPDDAAIAAARRIAEAHEAHQAAGAGAFALDGRMIDMPVVRAAWAVLARARAAGKLV